MGQVAALGGSWLLDALALLMLAVAAVSAARLAAAPRTPGSRGRAGVRGAAVIDDVAQLLMAIATAGMLAPALRTLPDGAWVVVFAVLTTWFAARSARAVRAGRAEVAGGRASSAGALAAPGCAPHLAHCAAMLYMFLALPAVPGSGGVDQGMTMAALSGSAAVGQAALVHVLAVLGALVVVGYCVQDVGHLSGKRYRLAAAVPVTGALLLSRASRLGTRVLMGVTMAVLLVVMT